MSITAEIKSWFENEIAILKQQISTLEGAFHEHASTAVEPQVVADPAPAAEVAPVAEPTADPAETASTVETDVNV